jgi:hypothetical protein
LHGTLHKTLHESLHGCLAIDVDHVVGRMCGYLDERGDR